MHLSTPAAGRMNSAPTSRDRTATNGEIIGLGTNALMSKLEHVVRTLANTRTYSRHLTAASWKLWCRLVSTVDTLFNAVSMNMAFNWILNPLL